MQRVLSFEQGPALSIPLRFFLTAPLFAIVAGVLLLWHGPAALTSRWSPLTLALTHLLTLGFLAMTMIGALLQILPVVAGVDVPRVRLTAGGVHMLLTLGAAVLSAAFYLSEPACFRLALPLLLAAFGWLLGACCIGLWRAQGASATLSTIRLALAALGITVVLGAAAASAFAWPLSLPLVPLTNLHASWGLLGWVGLLVIGVAYQVVPMFQVTPTYPRQLTRWLAWALFLLLGLWTASSVSAPEAMRQPWLLSAFLALGYLAFAGTTLYLLWHRKRPKPEATTLFWYVSAASLLGVAGLWCAGQVLPGLANAPGYPLALGILLMFGFAYSAINGMLYKIVPFLVWYHLQNRLAGLAKVPNVRQVVSDQVATRQFFAHLAALLLLLPAAAWPEYLVRPAAVAFIVSSAWLWWNLLAAARLYRERLRTAPAAITAAHA